MILMNESPSNNKSQIRAEIWNLMEKRGIARFPRPVFNRIPNFEGSENAAQRLIEIKEYKSARTIFCNPDSLQRPVREHILRDGKLLIMAPPRLKEDGFLVLSKKSILTDKIRRASTIKGAFQFGSIAKPSTIEKIDLKIAGSVAVDTKGGRVGKGGGVVNWLRILSCSLLTDPANTDNIVSDTLTKEQKNRIRKLADQAINCRYWSEVFS